MMTSASDLFSVCAHTCKPRALSVQIFGPYAISVHPDTIIYSRKFDVSFLLEFNIVLPCYIELMQEK